MSPEKKTILLTLVYKGREYPVYTAHDEYYSLMSLISDHADIPAFGLCSGMGSCGTCMVEIRGRNLPGGYRALSCGIPVDDALANVVVTVQEDRCY